MGWVKLSVLTIAIDLAKKASNLTLWGALDVIDFLCSCYHGHLTSLKPLSSYKLAQKGETPNHPDISIVSMIVLLLL